MDEDNGADTADDDEFDNMLDEDEDDNENDDDEDMSDSATCANDEGDVVKIKRKVSNTPSKPFRGLLGVLLNYNFFFFCLGAGGNYP